MGRLDSESAQNFGAATRALVQGPLMSDIEGLLQQILPSVQALSLEVQRQGQELRRVKELLEAAGDSS